MRKTLGVSLLVLLLNGSASAGEMPNGSPAPPPSQSTNAAQEPTGGEMPNGVTDSLTQITLDVLALLL